MTASVPYVTCPLEQSLALNDLLLQMIIERLLLRRGHHVMLAVNGRDAVNRYHLHHEDIDAIFMDSKEIHLIRSLSTSTELPD